MASDQDPILHYISEQASLFSTISSAVCAQLEQLAYDNTARHIVFVASGTSLNAAMAMAPCFETGGRHVDVLNPGAYMRKTDASRDETLAIFISQTGTSSTTIAALQDAQNAGVSTIAVTADPDAPFAKAAKTPLIMPIGAEPVGPKTKGYTGTLLTLMRLAERLNVGSKSALAEIPDLVPFLNAFEVAAIGLAKELDEAKFIAVFGEDRHFGTALEASLKITEISGLASAAFSIEEALHGRLHGADEKGCCIAIVATAEEREEAAHMAKIMGELDVPVRILNLTDTATPSDWVQIDLKGSALDTIAAIVPFQYLAAYLALARGCQPHQMRFPGLSQKLGIKTPSAG